MVAERYGISEQTVWKWRNRDSVHDRSHTVHRLQTTLTPAQEAVAVSLDDLLSVVREFLNPHVSRSGLDRCLRRHSVGNLRALKPAAPRPAHKPFKIYEPGYVHVDVKCLPQMADEDRRRYLFVAIVSTSIETGPPIGVEKGPLWRWVKTGLTRRSFRGGAGASGPSLVGFAGIRRGS